MRNFTFLCAFLLADSVFAEPLGCKNIVASQQIDMCAKAAMESADSQLNISYKKLMARVKSQYQVDPAQGEKFIAKLKESQRSWIKLRDTDCPLEAFEIEVGKPAYETTISNCIARMSLERSVCLDKTLPDVY
ncbi:lysozyme inhibitor LprI family protein [Pseudomonas chlororaphis]|uniref:lysozyme inhibitor LprI family protein n=1 Tax=Pseudomonas chlororaphis TaxID=587753 RepID=UPI00406C0B9B